MKTSSVYFILCLVFNIITVESQALKTNIGVALGLKTILGNQNKILQLGISIFGASSYQKVAIEGGLSFYAGYVTKRHTIGEKGLIYGYDVFYLAGYGQNNNLLISSLSQQNTALLYDEKSNNSFYGIGFGFEKQYLPTTLDEFEQRVGRFIMRISKNDYSYGFSFRNDFRIGNLLYGNATDYGDTGSLKITYSNAKNPNNIYQLAFGIQLFTPQQDYTKIADNDQNSDDGRKNVWHTQGVFKDTFYANAYLQFKWQYKHAVYQLKQGLESQKLGAYIQNKLHDGFGLNPRFPWNTAKKNSLFIEAESQVYYIRNK